LETARSVNIAAIYAEEARLVCFRISITSTTVFAVGIVRSGNGKRLASVVGEGAIAMPLVQLALAELQCVAL